MWPYSSSSFLFFNLHAPKQMTNLHPVDVRATLNFSPLRFSQALQYYRNHFVFVLDNAWTNFLCLVFYFSRSTHQLFHVYHSINAVKMYNLGLIVSNSVAINASFTFVPACWLVYRHNLWIIAFPKQISWAILNCSSPTYFCALYTFCAPQKAFHNTGVRTCSLRYLSRLSARDVALVCRF